MLSLNDKSNAIFMQLVDRLAGDKRLRIKRKDDGYLILELLETGIPINSRNSVGDLYSLVMSKSQDGGIKNPGMQFIAVDSRTGKTDADAFTVYPVLYRQDDIRINEKSVEIVDHRVYSVNKTLQKNHCAFANLWLKKITAKGFLKEYVHRTEDMGMLFCNCDNTPHLDGFIQCDETGNETETPSFESGYFLCRSCKRIIDAQTLEVLAIKDQTDVPKPVSQKLNTNQPLIYMSYAEKAKLLHTLCPDVMRGFITYVLDAATNVTDISGEWTIHWDNKKITVDGWIELAQVVKKKINDSFDDLVNNSNFFAIQLFDGYCFNFLMDCLPGYVTECPNEQFNRGIEFIFNL